MRENQPAKLGCFKAIGFITLSRYSEQVIAILANPSNHLALVVPNQFFLL
jgi:hypothetical protein